jgi:hypothetical protein
MATYKHLRSSTANKRPTTSITDGQLAINTNTASPGLFFKDSAGTGIVKVGPVHVGTTAPNATPAAGGSSGNYLGEQWLDTSVSPAQMKVWNGSAWVGIVADELPVSKLQDGDARQLLQTDAAGTGVEWTSNVDVPGTLDVTSTATFDSIARHPLGSAAAPTLTFTGDPNTGIYSPGADQVAVATNGTGRLFVDANGNVGVGTSSPVDFAGFVTLALADSSGAEVDFIKGSTVQGSLYNASDIFYIESKSTVPTAFVTNGTERLRITSAGLVGIGVSSPIESLSTLGNVSIGNNNASNPFSYLSFDASQYGAAQIRPVNDGAHLVGLAFYTDSSANAAKDPTEKVRIDSSGRVGIGTTAPSYALHVSGTGQVSSRTFATDATGDASFFVQNDGNGICGPLVYGSTKTAYGALASNETAFYSNRSTTIMADGGSTVIKFATGGNTERARIDSSGRLLVGTSSARSNVREGTDNETPKVQFESASNDYSEAGLSIINNSSSGFAPQLWLGRSASDSIGGNALVSSGRIGSISFNAADGTNFIQGARIQADIDGTSGSGDLPTRLTFSTTADGSASPTQRFVISSDGSHIFTNSQIVAPITDNAVPLGGSGYRWSEVWAANGTIQTSDQRAKTEITEASLGTEFIKALHPVSYKWIEGGKRDTGARDEDGNYIYESIPGERTHWGFIAQEVKQAVDVAGIDFGGWVLTDENDPDSQQALRYDQFIAPLTKALQEALERIEALEQRLNDAGIN